LGLVCGGGDGGGAIYRLPFICLKFLKKGGENESGKRTDRCNPTICDFIRDRIGIEIYSNRKDITKIIPIENKNSALAILRNNAVIKLIYDKKNNNEGFKSKNWGKCKGEDNYNDTCIILNKKTAKFWKEERLNELSLRTKK
jgi:hypothetical protein